MTRLLVISDPAAPHLRVLDQLPKDTSIVVADQPALLDASAPSADDILNARIDVDLLRPIWPLALRVQWLHTLSTGIEQVLFPELRASPVPMTNGRGVFKDSLAEFVIAGALFFAKNIRAMLRHQAEGIWQRFDVEEVRGKVMAIAGYGEIGRASAKAARALGMRVVALRRRPDLSIADPLLDRVYAPGQLKEMLGLADYVVCATPLTPETRGLIGETELRSMKPTAVLINVGRGPIVVESALLRALGERWIRGAALDVFDEEPLPAGHPFYRLENVLLSPHCADQVPGWLEQAMQCFIDNFGRFTRGEPLENMVDKNAGY